MSMYNQFRTDPEAEEKGIILDYGDFRVTVARAGGANKRFQRVLEAKTRPHQRAIQTNNFDNDRATVLMKEAFAEAVIRDWEVKKEDGTWESGIESSDGGVMPVTKENILKVFEDLPDLFQDIMTQAQTSMLFRASLREEAAKNS